MMAISDPDVIESIEEARGQNPKAVAATRDGKPPLDLLEREANENISRALHAGAIKYGKKNYHTIDIYLSTYVAALLRHAQALSDGEDIDEETGLNHLDLAGANLHVIYGARKHGNLIDDRGPQPRTEQQERRSSMSNEPHSSRGRRRVDR
jgi:dATP/dGTP diphosphohydrolase